MKSLLFTIAFFCTAFITNAQLQNTRWKAELTIGDNNVNVVFDFGKDSLVVTNADDNSTIETMTCAVTKTTFTLAKVSGQSDCGSDPATYNYAIKGKELTITKAQDDCYDRYSVIDGKTFTRLEK